MTSTFDIGMIGFGVMGRNLARNMAGRGLSVAVYDRVPRAMEDFLSGQAAGLPIRGCGSPAELAELLKRPRKVMLMVNAGRTVDNLIGRLLPLLDPGDIIIDGGNSRYRDTIRRTRRVERRGLGFIGAGISGGEEGALNGPAIMAGGSPDAWPEVRGLFESIAANAPDGRPCCGWMGRDGAGHFVKMAHNGIEYADMQLIAEASDFLRRGIGLDTDALGDVLAEWNRGDLAGYLIGITADIMRRRDDVTGAPLVDMILDAADQKGTGQWAGIAALELGVPAPSVTEAVFARYLSARKDDRVSAFGVLDGPEVRIDGIGAEEAAAMAGKALYAAKICSFAQGFQLMRAASEQYGWGLDFSLIARIWRAGCIIRADILDHIAGAFDNDPDLPNLVLAPAFRDAIGEAHGAWRKMVALAIGHGIPVPAMSGALAWYDGCRTAVLPANIIQAQRDYFGAHTYERTDRPRGERFHTDWAGGSGK